MTTLNPTQTTPWTTRLMAMAALSGVVLTLAYPSATRQFTWPWVGILSAVWLIPLVACLGAVSNRASWKFPNRSLRVGLVVLSLATVLAAALSPFARLSLLRIWPTLSGVALYFWLHDWLAPIETGKIRSQLLTKAISGLGAILAAVSAVAWRWQSAGQPGIVRNDIPFGHSTYTAGVLVLLLPWLIHSIFNSNGVTRVGWISAGTAGFVALFATSSRGGVMAVSAAGALSIGFILWRAAWPAGRKFLIVAAALIMISMAIFSNPRLRELVRGGAWGHSSGESNAQRSAMIEAGWKMGLAKPWIGWGPGTIPLVYPQERAQLNGGVDNVLQLHDTPAQLWATLGSAGILALILIVVATLRRLLQLTKQSIAQSTAWTAAASLTGYGLFSLTDHQLDLPAMNALLVLNLALLFQGERDANSIPLTRRQRQLGLTGAVALLIAPLFLTVRDLSARHAYEQSLALFEASDPDAGRVKLELAAQRAPYDPYYRHHLASRLLEQRARITDPTSQRGLAGKAASQLEQSLATGCFQEFAYLNLGWLALDNAKPMLAAHHFIAAAQEAPQRSGVYFGLGIALRKAGYDSLATRAFALEWINDPATYAAPVWEWPDFSPFRPQVEREANRLVTELASIQPDALYVRELWHWWSDGTSPPSRGFNQESDTFIETVAALTQKQPPPPMAARYAWGQLLTIWRQSPTDLEFTSLAGSDQKFSSALGLRTKRHPFPDWHGFFTAGVENEDALLISSLSARTGYGVLALHPDGPVLTDLYVRQQNRFVTTFASALFPAKGWISPQELLKRLPAVPIDNP